MRPIVFLSLCGLVACSDDPTPSGDATSATTTDATDATSVDPDATATTTSASETTDTSVEPDTNAPFAITTGELTATSACGGASVEVPFSVSGEMPLGTRLSVMLSGPLGVFTGFRTIGMLDYAGVDGVIEATIPSDVDAGIGYRVRVVATDWDHAFTDNTSVLALSSGPELGSAYFPRSFGTLAGTYSAELDTDAVSVVWDLGEGAAPATSTDFQPSWSYTTTGHKVITLTGTDGNGCTKSETVFSSIDVLGCDFAFTSDFAVLHGSGNGIESRSWLCAGADYRDGGGRQLAVVEPAARFEYTGGGQYAAIVRAGGTYVGNFRDVVVYETGATLIDIDDATELLECPTLTFDYADAPADGCVDPDQAPVIVTLAPITGPTCPGRTFDLAFTATGTPAPENRYVIQLSDASGDFGDATTLARVASTATSGTLPIAVPEDLAGGSYALRVIATHPSGVGPTVGLGVFAVPEAAFQPSSASAFVDETITLTDTTLGDDITDIRWDFGPDADASATSGASVTVSWSTLGDKVVTMTATHATGCDIRTTRTIKVFGCTVTLPADTQVVTGSEVSLFNINSPALICGGASGRVINGATDFYVMEGGQLQHLNGGSNIFYVEDGARFDGGSNDQGLVVHEPAALIGNADHNQRACDTLTLDTSALATECPPFTPTPAAIALPDDPPVQVCPGTTLQIAYTQTGLFAPGSQLELQLSNAVGDFDPPIATSTTRTATHFTITVPQSAPFGAGYYFRLVASEPALTALGTTVFTVPGAPFASFTVQGAPTLTGTTVAFTNLTTGATSQAWTFDDGASLATFDGAAPPPVSWATEGDKTITLTASNGTCEASATRSIAVHSCAPRIPTDTTVVTGTTDEDYDTDAVWVCEGGSYSRGGGSYAIFIEPGATYQRQGGGSYTVYVPTGATYLHQSGGTTTIIRAAGVTLPDVGSNVVLTCPADLTYDTSVAPSPGCP